jgi:hypothetical protein
MTHDIGRRAFRPARPWQLWVFLAFALIYAQHAGFYHTLRHLEPGEAHEHGKHVPAGAGCIECGAWAQLSGPLPIASMALVAARLTAPQAVDPPSFLHIVPTRWFRPRAPPAGLA